MADVALSLNLRHGACLIPRFDDAIFSLEWKEALWDKFIMGAPRPRTLSELQYSDPLSGRALRSNGLRGDSHQIAAYPQI